jgi:hypothetical protein
LTGRIEGDVLSIKDDIVVVEWFEGKVAVMAIDQIIQDKQLHQLGDHREAKVNDKQHLLFIRHID